MQVFDVMIVMIMFTSLGAIFPSVLGTIVISQGYKVEWYVAVPIGICMWLTLSACLFTLVCCITRYCLNINICTCDNVDIEMVQQ